MGENQRLREKLDAAQTKITNEEIMEIIMDRMDHEEVIMGEDVRVCRAFIQELRENLALAQAHIKGLQEKNEQNKRKVIIDQMDHKKRIFVCACVLMIISYICLFACVFNIVIDNCKLREANITRLQEKTSQSERKNDVNEVIYQQLT